MNVTERAVVTATLLAAVGIAIASTVMLQPAARMVPLVVAIPTFVLLTIELVKDSRRPSAVVGADGRSEYQLLVWLTGSLVLIAVLGIIAGASLWLGLFLRYRSREPWRVAALSAGVLAAILIGILVLLLRTPPAAGALVDWTS